MAADREMTVIVRDYVSAVQYYDYQALQSAVPNQGEKVEYGKGDQKVTFWVTGKVVDVKGNCIVLDVTDDPSIVKQEP